MENLENEVVEDTTLTEESALLKAYKELEKNTVSKEAYDKRVKELEEKNKLYLKAITEGERLEAEDSKDVSLEDKIVELSKFKGTNLDYWTKMTSAIDSMLKSVPESEIVKITGSEGLEEMVKVNEGMKQLVKDSNGNPDMFRTLYKDRVIDSAPRISSEIEKAGSLTNYLINKQQK